jgi:hypothetical protein
MKDLTKERIKEIVESSDDMFMALLNLYKEAIAPVEWEDVETITPWGIHTNRVTSESILEEMHKKFTGPTGDSWPVNALILNKGFSAAHDEVPDWKIEIAEDCFTVKKETHGQT